jgi:hypothetical protein
MAEKNIALVAMTRKISAKDLSRAETAFRKRLRNDFYPIWQVSAVIQAYSKMTDVPKGAWPVIVRDKLDAPGALSYHTEKDGTPFAAILYGQGWEFFASHDLIEMLLDPNGNRLARGPSPRAGDRHEVSYLVEVCDPCASEKNGYDINGIHVADFCTPPYYIAKSSGERYSFTKAISKPFEVLRGGYLSWTDGKHWWQTQWFAEEPTIVDLGVVAGGTTKDSSGKKETSLKHRKMSMQMVMFEQMKESQEPHAENIRADIEALIGKYQLK